MGEKETSKKGKGRINPHTLRERKKGTGIQGGKEGTSMG